MPQAIITGGDFTGPPTKTKVLTGSMVKRWAVREISGAGDVATGSLFANGRPTHIVQTNGIYNSSGTTYPLPVVGSAITGSPLFKLSRAVVIKSQRVKNTTGAEDAFGESVFTAGRPVYQGSGFGWASDGDAVMNDLTDSGGDIASLDLPIYSVGSIKIEGITKITEYTFGLPYTSGGPVPVRFQFLFNDATPTTANTPFSTTSYAALLDTSTGSTYAGTVVPYSVRLDIDYENALPTVVDVNGPFSGTITIT